MRRTAIILYSTTITFVLIASCFVETPYSAAKGLDFSTLLCSTLVCSLVWIFAAVAMRLRLSDSRIESATISRKDIVCTGFFRADESGEAIPTESEAA